jgi:putative ABC transport system permease protein
MIAATSAVPGVQSVAAVTGGLPLTGSWSRTGIEVVGRPKLEGDDDSIDRRLVTPNYLQLMRIPLIRGRYLSDDDRSGAAMVIVINDAAAQKYWPGQDPIGQRVILNKKERVVVGIVGNIRHLGPETPPRQECYIPFDQEQNIGGMLVMRTAGDPIAVLPAVKAAIWSVNPEQRVSTDTLTLEAYMDRLIAQRRFNMALLALFGTLGLVIAAVGIYGVMSYIVAQRTNEIGVRVALGATRRNVVSMVLVRAVLLMMAGLLLGTAISWPLSKLLEGQSLLFQTQTTSPVIYLLAVVVLAATGLAASAVPAFRAASIDPLVALKRE